MEIVNSCTFANGTVYCLRTELGNLIETTDTFLPYYTKNSTNGNNLLTSGDLGNREERWMIGVSTMSGCPLKCKFCATGNMRKSRLLTADEITEQVFFILNKNPSYYPEEAKEFKINYTRMGEPFLNVKAVREAIERISARYPNTHHYVSTIGVKGSDFSWVTENVTLQISLHACSDEKRDFLIPYKKKMTIEELGQIRTRSKQKTTLNLTLVDETDFDLDVLKRYFDPEHFFIKLSPINPNEFSDKNLLGEGVIKVKNLV